jgi:hypothetical protein
MQPFSGCGRFGLRAFTTRAHVMCRHSALPNWRVACHRLSARCCYLSTRPQRRFARHAQCCGGHCKFHGDESAQACHAACAPDHRPYLRAARIPLGEAGRAFDLLKYAQDFSQAQAILLDAHIDGYGGGGQTFHWSLLPPNVNAHLVLSGGLTAANVIDGIAQVRPRCKTLAVDVSSGIEVAGQKASRTRHACASLSPRFARQTNFYITNKPPALMQ